MKGKDELRELLANRVLRIKPSDKADIFDKCVEDKKLTRLQATNLENGTLDISTLNNQELYWLFKYSSDIVKRLGDISEYFTPVEIQEYEFYEIEDEGFIKFPITFKNVENLTPSEGKLSKQYAFYVTVRELKYLQSSGLLQTIPELQRGGRKNAYDELKTKVNRSRVREIANKISAGEYFYNSVSFNLINDDDADWEYNNVKNTITINNGILIVPDGNHRAFSCESVPEGDPHLDDKFHVLFTFLTRDETRKKIAQEWNTEPVNVSHRKYMADNNSNKILNAILRSDELDELIRKNIITSSDHKTRSQGAYVYDDISKAIQKYYGGNKISTKEEQRELANWIVEFLNRIAFLFEDDIKNFTSVIKSKWNVSSYAMYGLIYLSSEIRGDTNWKYALDKYLSQIDFTDTSIVRSNKMAKAKISEVENIFKGAVNSLV